MEAEGMRQQFPFYNELQAIFAARMQRMLWMEAEGGGGGSKKKSITLSSDEEDENIGEEMSEGEKASSNRKKRKTKGITTTTTTGTGGAGSSSNSNSENFINNLREMLDEFMKQQMTMEMQWIQAHEAREEERRKREIEWRQNMEALENERLMMERRWREREDQRRIREEARAEKRDALITALLNKLRQDEDL